jgi:catechol 2,3-dioxygenase-like lactoylglutathione lyase family enzyme
VSTTELSSSTDPGTPRAAAVRMRLEVVVLPVADVDRAKAFYAGLGWRLDGDAGGGDFRLVQVTPPGSNASIIFGRGVTAGEPGSVDGLVLAVDDIETARDALAAQGVEVSEAFHEAGGGLVGGFHPGNEQRASGPDPEGRSYATYASFNDPDGNRWVLQEIRERLPGRVDGDVAALAELLHETAEHHGDFEAVSPPHDWWDWYAAYFDARQRGQDVDGAVAAAGRHMAEVKHVTVSAPAA